MAVVRQGRAATRVQPWRTARAGAERVAVSPSPMAALIPSSPSRPGYR